MNLCTFESRPGVGYSKSWRASIEACLRLEGRLAHDCLLRRSLRGMSHQVCFIYAIRELLNQN